MSNLIRMSRRQLLASGGKAAALVAAVGIAPRFIRPGRAYAADALAPGMIGGPTGFEGAERYQYGPDTPEGRAVEAIKAMKGAATAPTKIVLGLSDGSIGQLTQPFPAGAPSIKDLWEKETGITLEIVGVPNGQEFTKTMQDISTKGGAYDIYAVEWNRLGDLAETGGIVKLDEFVAAHKPEWDDPETRLCQRRQGCVAAQPVSRLDLRRVARRRLPVLGLPHRPVRRRGREEGVQGQVRLRSRAAQDLEAARRDRDVLLPPGQGSVRLDRPAQPGLGLHQLVPALRLDGLAEPVPVRR